MTVILDARQIERILGELTAQILGATERGVEIAVIGIRSRGEVLAQRLSGRLSEALGREVPCGTLDITLYRDDLNSPQGCAQPQVRTTDIGFDIDEKIIILVDDVLFTGRTTRAAMDALMDFGRPRRIELAVLVDRGEKQRELPIKATYVARVWETSEGDTVNVYFREAGFQDQVVVESKVEKTA